MIKIIEQIGTPIRLPAYRVFLPGHIVKLVRTPTSVYCSLSDSINPFGMVTGLPDEFGLVPVLYNTASIIKTDKFETKCEYTAGDFIYSNNHGIITSLKLQSNSVPIGYVEKEREPENPFLEIRWI